MKLLWYVPLRVGGRTVISIPYLRAGICCDESITWKSGLSKLVISCQNNNLKSVYADYIYRICYKNAKNGKPSEKSLPLLKNDITGSEPISKLGIHSRTHKVSSGCDIVLRYHKKIRPLIVLFYCRYHRFGNYVFCYTTKFIGPWCLRDMAELSSSNFNWSAFIFSAIGFNKLIYKT
jgi:hypothetical protein